MSSFETPSAKQLAQPVTKELACCHWQSVQIVNLTCLPDDRFNEEDRAIGLDIILDEGKQFHLSRKSNPL